MGLRVAIEPLKKCGACGFTMHSLEVNCINCQLMSWSEREQASIKKRNKARSIRQIKERADRKHELSKR